jgi:Flp pilus assembly protein CpaB
MTQTARRLDTSSDQYMVEPTPKRRLLSRISLGHVVMLLSGLLAFLLVLVVLRDRSEVISVAVAAVDIEAGTTLSDQDVTMVELGNADDALIAALLDEDEVGAATSDQWIATQTIVAGTALRQSDFSPQLANTDLRAMSIEIDPGNAVNGAIGVGDRIDVITVRKGVARYVVTNAEVVAVSGVDSSISSSGFTVTIAVDGATSLRLASALNLGDLEIVRSTGAAPADLSDLYNPYQPVADETEPAADDSPGG